MAPAIDRGFSTHGAGTRSINAAMQHVDEIGHVQPRLGGPHAHGQLVAEIARGGLAHAGNAQVLAQHGGQFDIEIVERDDAVEDACTRQVADGVAQVDRVPAAARFRQVEDLVDGVHRPVGLVHHGRALAFRFAQEFVALLIARQAQKRHDAINPAEAPTHSRFLL